MFGNNNLVYNIRLSLIIDTVHHFNVNVNGVSIRISSEISFNLFHNSEKMRTVDFLEESGRSYGSHSRIIGMTVIQSILLFGTI